MNKMGDGEWLAEFSRHVEAALESQDAQTFGRNVAAYYHGAREYLVEAGDDREESGRVALSLTAAMLSALYQGVDSDDEDEPDEE